MGEVAVKMSQSRTSISAIPLLILWLALAQSL